ncbi:hypothetical protein BC940DRAFT_313766 [Gongronella butleri]|nr:hypothetical protein BC940DRAFT_313766 [Gongronella butleri]
MHVTEDASPSSLQQDARGQEQAAASNASSAMMHRPPMHNNNSSSSSSSSKQAYYYITWPVNTSSNPSTEYDMLLAGHPITTMSSPPLTNVPAPPFLAHPLHPLQQQPLNHTFPPQRLRKNSAPAASTTSSPMYTWVSHQMSQAAADAGNGGLQHPAAHAAITQVPHHVLANNATGPQPPLSPPEQHLGDHPPHHLLEKPQQTTIGTSAATHASHAPPSASSSISSQATSPGGRGEEQKRQRNLEKNRIAAYKCRQRKKEWLHQLQQNVDALTSENEQLQQQVMALREEIVNLKTLLLTFADCPQARANGMMF